MLKNPAADIRAIGRNGPHKKMADGALNDSRTWYHEPYRRVPYDKNRPDMHPWQPVSTAKLVSKLYLKNGLGESLWKLRLEVTLRGSSLRSRLGSLTVPGNLKALCLRMDGLTVSDFWKFEIFDGVQFKQIAKTLAKKHRPEMSVGKYIYVQSLINFLDMSKHQSATRQKSLAVKVAKALQSKGLLQKLYKGYYLQKLL